jgi:hypothetical protein
MNRQGQTVINALEGQGVVVDIARIKPRLEEKFATVRLRFDKEALRFIADVQSALHEVVPNGKTLVFAITAPIRLASKTTDALEERVRNLLARRTARIDFAETIHGNQIRVRLIKGSVNRTRKAIGFVHNPESDPEILFDVMRSLLRCVT